MCPYCPVTEAAFRGSCTAMRIPSDAAIDETKFTGYLLVARRWDDKSAHLRRAGFELKNWLDLRDASDYIQLYDGNADTLRQSLHRIQATAKTILSSLPIETPTTAEP